MLLRKDPLLDTHENPFSEISFGYKEDIVRLLKWGIRSGKLVRVLKIGKVEKLLVDWMTESENTGIFT